MPIQKSLPLPHEHERRPSMEVSQLVLNGERFLQNGCPVILGISPSNRHYYQLESLQRLFDFAANKNSDKVFLFIPDKICEHNYRALGSQNPKKTAREKTNWLRNKCKKAIHNSDLCNASYSFIRWEEEVESCPQYNKASADIRGLYEANDEFGNDIRDSTEAALKSLQRGREKEGFADEKKAERKLIDIEEGVLYLLKELAFIMSVPSIYENCKEFVFVYHRPWPVLERFCGGYYDGIEKPSVGFVVSEQ